MKRFIANPSSAVVAEVVDRAASPGYEEWWAKVTDSGFCAAPVRLVRADSVEQGEVLARCKNRRAGVCPSCSQLYAGDTWRLVHAGMAGDEEFVAAIEGHPMVFATLTAPSFGAVHSANRDLLGRPAPCRPGRDRSSCRHDSPSGCSDVHHREDPIVGQPLCAACYDYLGHALFTWHSPELWHRFTVVLRRLVGRRCRSDGHDPNSALVSYVKVVEMQRRAVPHFHTVIRLDGLGPAQEIVPPVTGLNASDIAALVLRASRDVALTLRVCGRSVILRFGEQVDARPLVATTGTALGVTTSQEVSARRVAAYLAKYVTKSVGDIGVSARRLHPGVIDELDVSDHVRRILKTIADLAEESEYRAVGAWLHTLGYRGHVTTKTRRYSTTMGALRARRDAWQQAQRRGEESAHSGDDSVPASVDTDWRYLGCGHRSEGEAFLAVSAAQRVREMRRIAREELAENTSREEFE